MNVRIFFQTTFNSLKSNCLGVSLLVDRIIIRIICLSGKTVTSFFIFLCKYIYKHFVYFLQVRGWGVGDH